MKPTDDRLMEQFGSVLLDVDQVLLAVRVSKKTLRNWISDGEFPRPLPGGTFRVQDVAGWIDQNAKASAA